MFVLAGLLAGASSLQLTAQSSIVPGLVGDRLRSALAFNFGSYQLTGIIGPALGGLTIAAFGVGAAYAVDVVSCLALVAAALAIGPQRPTGRVGDTTRSSRRSARACASSAPTTPSSAAS